jgi:hypothetical protein
MTTIFEYMGWCKHKFDYSGVPKCEYCGKYMMQVRMGLERENHPLDGNDMVAAINTMRERGDWKAFDDFLFKDTVRRKVEVKGIQYHEISADIFGSPETFFCLMQEALDKHIIG